MSILVRFLAFLCGLSLEVTLVLGMYFFTVSAIFTFEFMGDYLTHTDTFADILHHTKRQYRHY